jgi:hypothetical protein
MWVLMRCVDLLGQAATAVPADVAAAAGVSTAGHAKFSPVDLNTSSLKMYWGVAKQFGGQELWRELLQVRMSTSTSSSSNNCSSAGCSTFMCRSLSTVVGSSPGGCAN